MMGSEGGRGLVCLGGMRWTKGRWNGHETWERGRENEVGIRPQETGYGQVWVGGAGEGVKR